MMLQPCDVIWLDATWLKASGGCFTNSADSNFDVDAPHYFLITGVYGQTTEVLAAALLSNKKPSSANRIKLDNNLKIGPGQLWRQDDSHIYRFQTWRIPEAVIDNWIALGNPAAVRTYAASQPQAVEHIRLWMAKNTNAWHPAISRRSLTA